MDNDTSYTGASDELDAAAEYSGCDTASDPNDCGGGTYHDGDGNYDTQQAAASGPYYDPATGAYYYYDTAGTAVQLDTANGELVAEQQSVQSSYDAYSGSWNTASNDSNSGLEGDQEGSGDGNFYGDYDGYEYDEATGQYLQSPFEYGDAEEQDPLHDETYWEQEHYNYDPADAATDEAEPTGDSPETIALSDPTAALQGSVSETNATKSAASSTHKKKPKSKAERMQMRQELLEKQEADRIEQQQQNAAPGGDDATGSPIAAGASPGTRVARKPPTFLAREKAKIHLQIRKARAIARKRMPVQVRILTQPRQHLSPLEKYFGARSVEAALTDIFWAALKGDERRVRHLVEVERVSPSDCTFDPWHMQQTPLHWAAKGGSSDVVEYLIRAGAVVRCLDENGSFPLHHACWAGHVDATLALLKASDARDLYAQDFDAAFAPLDWARVRGHTVLVRAIEKYEDSQWLPKFIDDLVRGIIRYKIKVFKPPLRPAKLTAAATAMAATAATQEILATTNVTEAAAASSDPSPFAASAETHTTDAPTADASSTEAHGTDHQRIDAD